MYIELAGNKVPKTKVAYRQLTCRGNCFPKVQPKNYDAIAVPYKEITKTPLKCDSTDGTQLCWVTVYF